jgi:hypothetical protein
VMTVPGWWYTAMVTSVLLIRVNSPANASAPGGGTPTGP